MSTQQIPSTFEGMMALFLETRAQTEATNKAVAEQIEATNKAIAEQIEATNKAIAERQQKTDEQIEKATKSAEKANKAAEEANKAAEEANKAVADMAKNTDERIGSIVNRLGDFVECMVGTGSIVDQFQKHNIAIKSHSRNKTFGTRGTRESGQIDVFLENGDIVVLVEAKLALPDTDIDKHIERLEKYRLYSGDKRRILGAVAGGVVEDEAVQYAHEKGMYVIVQSGRAVEIITPPEGFTATEW